MGRIVGIDLGTTFSVIAFVEDDGTPRVIKNMEGATTTPSAVLIDEDETVVGEYAINEFKINSEHVCRWVKQMMHDRDWDFHGMSPAEISAEIIRKLKNDAEAELGEAITDAVITCPAYFGAIEREATQQAGELAGLQVQEIVQEPVAAAIYWGVSNLEDGERVVVCDLGGGTFDATVLLYENDVFRPIGTYGDRKLGGHNWTTKLMEHVAREIEQRRGEDPIDDLATYQQLYEACESAKRDLSDVQTTTIRCGFRGQIETVEVTRDEFEEITEDLLEQVPDNTNIALHEKAGLDWDDIQHVLPVGGATKMPAVIEALRDMSGMDPVDTGATADTMVALGAAVMSRGEIRAQPAGIRASGEADHAGLRSVTVDRACVRNLGTQAIVWYDDGPAIENVAIIDEGTSLPTEESHPLQTSVGNQQHFDVPVVEFDAVGDDVIVDTWRFTGLPDCQKGTPVDVTFRYADLSGSIDVDAVCQNAPLEKERIRYEEPDLEELEATAAARDVVFALDTSGSMRGDKIDRAKEALKKHARDFIEAGGGSCQVGLILFARNAQKACDLSNDPDVIDRAVDAISTGGTTAMHEGVVEATRLLQNSSEESVQEIALVTDGKPDDAYATEEAVRSATSADIELSVLGIGEHDVDTEFLRSLTPKAFTIEGAEGLDEWISGFLTADSQARQQPAGLTWGRSE